MGEENISVPQRPLLLLIDGHKSHITLDVVDICRENNIVLLCLPPHTTHALQPLDVSVFKSLKDHFSKSVRALSFTKKNFIVTKKEFSRVVKSPFEKAFCITNVKSGFKKCGIYPFNRDAVSRLKMIPSTVHGSSLTPSSTESSSESSTPYPSSEAPSCSGSDVPPIMSPLTSQTNLPCPSTTSSVVSTSPSPVVNLVVSVPSTPSPVVSPIQPTGSTPSPVVNPLVDYGLISPDLCDILALPSGDAAIAKNRVKRITGARDLTADDYAEMLREDKRKKEEAEIEKEKRKEERERKRREKEEKMKQKDKAQAGKGRGRGRGRGKGRGCGKGKQKAPVNRMLNLEDSTSESDPDTGILKDLAAIDEPDSSDGMVSEPEAAATSYRPHRQRQLPARFRSDSESDQSDGAVCSICQKNVPDGLASEFVFWVDCDMCGVWVHNLCAFGNNTVTRLYKCENC